MEAKVQDYTIRGADKNLMVCKDCKHFRSSPGYCKLHKKYQPRKTQRPCFEGRGK